MFRIRRIAVTAVASAAIVGAGAIAVGATGATGASAATSAQVRAVSAGMSDAAVARRLHQAVTTVTAISASSISVKTKSGETKTFGLTSDTKYVAPPAVSLTAGFVRVGDHVVVVPTEKGGDTAKAVHVLIAHLAGEVTAVTPTSISIKGPKGKTSTFAVSSSTTYKSKGAAASASDVTVGSVVLATGRISDGTLNALQVNVGEKGSIKNLRQRIHDRIQQRRNA